MRPQIEERAAKLLADHGISKIPIPVERIAFDEDIQIARVQFDGSESGFAMSNGGVRIIGVNQSNHPRRQRFTIAHELGHLFLHHGPGDSLTVDHFVRLNFRDKVSSMATNEQEIQANAFAAALLMPRQFVTDEVDSADGVGLSADKLVQVLAGRFDVSKDAMSFRLINLGLLSV